MCFAFLSPCPWAHGPYTDPWPHRAEAVDVLEGESLEPLTEDDLLILQVAARARQRGFSEELSRFPP